MKAAEGVVKMPFLKAVDRLGFNGIVEEIGEERVGDVLKFAFDLDGKRGYSFEQFLDAMFPPIEQLGQEALAFGVMGLGANAVDKGIRKIPKAGEKYTKEGFLIDAGIFRQSGYDSYLDKRVKEELENRGYGEDEIDNAVNFASRDEKIEFLKEVSGKVVVNESGEESIEGNGQSVEEDVKYNEGDVNGKRQRRSETGRKTEEQQIEAIRRFVEGATRHNNQGSDEDGLFVRRDNLWVINNNKTWLFDDDIY